MADYLKVEDMKEAVMECPVCSYIYDSDEKTPRLMTCCMSTVCSKCLTDIIARGEGTSIDCPLCRRSHDVSASEGLDMFPLERVMMKMVEYLKVQKGDQVSCTGCPDDNRAMARCKDCGLFLCSECLNAHRRNGITRDHTTINFDELRSQSFQNFTSSHYCSQHKLNPLQFYCAKCDKAVCVSCTVVEHKECNGHKIYSLDEIGQERAAQTDEYLSKLDEKIRSIGTEADVMKKKKKILNTSKSSAAKKIETMFDSLIEQMIQRKNLLLTEVDTRYEVHYAALQNGMKQNEALLSRVVSASEYIRQVRGTADNIECIQLFSRVKHILDGIIQEEPAAHEWTRKGIGLDPTFARDLSELIRNMGVIKTITYMDDQSNDEAQTLYIQPAHLDEVPTVMSKTTVCVPSTTNSRSYEISSFHADRIIILGDTSIGGQPAVIHCPRLRFDEICQSRDCTVTPDGIFINRKLDKSRSASGSETGCRLKIGRRVLVSTPFAGVPSQLWQMKLKAKIKTAADDYSMIFEAALTPKPVDAAFAQPSGFSLNLSHCDVHKQMCIKVRNNGQLQADIPAIVNKPEVEKVLDLGFLLDGGKKLLHVFDMEQEEVLVTVGDMDTSQPLWMLYYVDTPEESDMEVSLRSGVDVEVTDRLVQLLMGVCNDTLCDV